MLASNNKFNKIAITNTFSSCTHLIGLSILQLVLHCFTDHRDFTSASHIKLQLMKAASPIYFESTPLQTLTVQFTKLCMDLVPNRVVLDATFSRDLACQFQ